MQLMQEPGSPGEFSSGGIAVGKTISDTRDATNAGYKTEFSNKGSDGSLNNRQKIEKTTERANMYPL